MRPIQSFLALCAAFVLIGGSYSGLLPASVQANPEFLQKKSGFHSYRGVEIGMTKDQVREKLGKIKDEYGDEDDFEFSENEGARIFYAAEKTVKAMVITYSGNIDSAPAPKAVVGEEIDAKPDGGMYKMVRFPDEGFWISYVRTGGDKPSIVITLQQLPKLTE